MCDKKKEKLNSVDPSNIVSMVLCFLKSKTSAYVYNVSGQRLTT